MFRLVFRLTFVSMAVAAWAVEAHAVRVTTSPATASGDPAAQFANIAITPNGNTIVATGKFNQALTGDRVYSLPAPSSTSTGTVTITQLSTQQFTVNQGYDVRFAPVVSPNGQTILYSHDAISADTNTIYTMPIGGELTAFSFDGLFSASPITGTSGGESNSVAPGMGNFSPIYSPNGSTIFFVNGNAGFNGAALPNFIAPTEPNPYADAPEWDQLYAVPSGGGTPVAITSASDGDIDAGLFAVTPDGASIVYAPDRPITERKDRSDIRPRLFTVPATGGASTEISIPAPAHEFSIQDKLAITPNGQNVLFIGDYETLGKNELFSVPITGGTPTRISDNLPFAGDVKTFQIAPSGAAVAYAAGQNASSNLELFLTPISGGAGNSVRVSDPAPSNSGLFDVASNGSVGGQITADGGQILFSPNSSQIYYLGDMNTENVKDLYVVDTTAKPGLVPSSFTFVGTTSNEFFTESNWQDAQGNNPPANSINVGVPIRHSLIIDGDSVVATGAPQQELTFQEGGSLELTAGSMLTSSLLQLEFNPGSGLKLTDATIRFREDIRLSGTNVLTGGTIESQADDVEFNTRHRSIINGTTILSGNSENVFFDNSATSIFGATIVSEDRLGLRYEVNVTVTDTMIDVNGGRGDVEDIFGGIEGPPQGEGSVLTLKGSSTLLADTFEDGVSLVVDDTSVATLLGSPNSELVDTNGTSTITVASTGAELVILNPSDFDPRAFVINGLTGMSYLDDPSAWNITDWNGLTALASLKLASSALAGDFDNDNDVDGADFLLAQREPDPAAAVALWRVNYGTSLSSPSATGIPEPASLTLLLVAIGACGQRRGNRHI